MKNKPKLSLIVPIYNVEKYLADCLNSIISQSYQDIEVICINDGSPDNAYEIAVDFAQRDPRVKAFSFENGGLSVARNRGLELAQGEYIQFVDSDDMLPPGSLAKAMTLIEKNQLDLFMGESDVFYDGVEATAKDLGYKKPEHLHNQISNGYDAFQALTDSTFHPVAWLYIFKKSAIGNLTFYPGIYHEDNLFSAQLLLKKGVNKVMISPTNIYSRRIRPDSIMTESKNLKHVTGYWTVFNELINQYKHEPSPALKKFAVRMLLHASYILSRKTQTKFAEILRWKLRFIKAFWTHSKVIFSIANFIKVLFPILRKKR